VCCSDGGVYIFKNGEAAYAAQGHKGAVYMVQGLKQGLLTGGRDGTVILWDNTMKKQQAWDFKSRMCTARHLTSPHLTSRHLTSVLLGDEMRC
jgi:hypothetical protein